MPNRLSKLRLTKVDLVDRGAQGPHAAVRIYKRDLDGEVTETPDPQEGSGGDQKEKSVGKLSEEVRKGLPDDVQEYLTSLEGDKDSLESELADAREQLEAADAGGEGGGAGTEEEPVLSKMEDLPEEVRQYLAKRDADFESLSKRAEEAEDIAKKERDARQLREWRDRVAKYEPLGIDVDEVAQEFKDLADVNEELTDKLVKRLDALTEQVQTSELFAEIGKRGPAEGSAESQLEGIVKSYREADPNVDEPSAWDRALAEHPELYERYLAERS